MNIDIEQASAILKLVGDFVGTVGLPVALVLLAVLFAYMVGRFVAPIIRAHSEKHLEFVESVKCANTKQTSILESISEAIKAIADVVLNQNAPKPPGRKR